MNIKLNTLVDTVEVVIETSNALLNRIVEIEKFLNIDRSTNLPRSRDRERKQKE